MRSGGLTDADRVAFNRLSTCLIHRGPDGFRCLEGRSLLMGMHRLSIIDIEHGWAPFSTPNGDISLIANGEIYNSSEISEHPDFHAIRLESRSDLAVIPHLYNRHGLEYVHRLRGMFSIAIWDKRVNKLILTRDRLGEKPLFWTSVDGAFWFSSEQTPLVKSGLVRPSLDISQLERYLTFGYVPEPACILEGVNRVPAGHHLQVDLQSGVLKSSEYWRPLDFVGDRRLSTDELELGIREAVQLTTRSDVPVAVALSGGVDSSLVAALAKEARGDVHAVSVGYVGKNTTDESHFADALAKYLDIPFHRIQIESHDAAANFETMCQRRDEPISDIAGIGYDALAQTAKSLNIPVLLNGQGGDEFFWGYPWVQRLAQRAHKLDQSPGTRRLDRLPRHLGSLAHWIDDFGGLRTDSALASHKANLSGYFDVPLYTLQPGHHIIHKQVSRLLPSSGSAGTLRYPRQGVTNSWPLFGLGVVDTYLKTNGLAQIDRLTMAHSIEGRNPLVDFRVAELALSSMARPETLAQPPKARLREIAARTLPLEVVTRPKMGFTPPIRDWIRDIWRIQGPTLRSPVLADATEFHRPQLLKNIQSPIFLSGQVSQVALRLLTLELWFRSLI